MPLGSVKNGTYCREVTECKDTQQTGLATSAISNDDQFPRDSPRQRLALYAYIVSPSSSVAGYGLDAGTAQWQFALVGVPPDDI